MKKITLSFIVVAFTLSTAIGQVELGVKAGINSFDLASQGIQFQQGNKSLELNFADAEYGVHFGLYSRLSFLGLYVEPAVIFNSNTVNFKLDELSEDGTFTSLKSETYRNVDVPFLVGTKLGFLRIQGGPVAHFYLDSTSDLFSISGYKHNFEQATYGAQLGLGLDIWKLRFDLLYETNFSKFGEHITVDGQQFAFDDGADRFVMTVGVRF